MQCPTPINTLSVVVNLMELFKFLVKESYQLEGTSGDPQVQPIAKASPIEGCTGTRPGRFWMSSEKETPQSFWAACSSVMLLSQ